MEQAVSRFVQSLQTLLSPSRIAEAVVNALPSLLIALVTLLLFYVGWVVGRRLALAVMKRAELDNTAQAFVLTVAKTLVGATALVASLGAVGIDTASVLTSLGVAGLTIGFAAKDALSNVISGVFIFWDRPFVIGDLVEIDGKYGRVDLITMRSTRVVTVDGKMLAVPNATIVNQVVASYTNFPHLRLDIDATVAVTEDLGRVRKILLGLVESDDRYNGQPAPRVVVKELNDYNVKVCLQAWLKNEKEHVAARFALREAVFEALRSANVDMPYETLQLQPMEVSIPTGNARAAWSEADASA